MSFLELMKYLSDKYPGATPEVMLTVDPRSGITSLRIRLRLYNSIVPDLVADQRITREAVEYASIPLSDLSNMLLSNLTKQLDREMRDE